MRRSLHIVGQIESQVDQMLQPLYREWETSSPPVMATILAKLGQIDLHLSTRHASRDEGALWLERATAQVLDVLGGLVFSTDGRRLEEVVGDLLAAGGLRVAAAESCTGGLLTSRLTDGQGERLHIATIEVLAEWTERLRVQSAGEFPSKVTAFRAEMAVHGRYGMPCPVCGTKVQRIRYADNETNYCPRCQTDGKLLADRSLSRLLKRDWPKSIDELERLRSERTPA